jgi:arylsulfatase A-like enzyme
MFDHSTRIPLIITGPGIPKGKQIDSLVYQHSMFATTCELVGTAVPHTIEFPSLAGLLRGTSHRGQDAVFCYYKDFQRSVRTEKHKLIVYPKASVVQLFDIEKDPWETRDLASDARYSVVRKNLFARLRKFQADLADPLPLS